MSLSYTSGPALSPRSPAELSAFPLEPCLVPVVSPLLFVGALSEADCDADEGERFVAAWAPLPASAAGNGRCLQVALPRSSRW